MVKGALAHLKSFIVVLSIVPDFSVGDATAHLKELNAMGLVGHQNNRVQVAALNLQSQGSTVIMMTNVDKTVFIMT